MALPRGSRSRESFRSPPPEEFLTKSPLCELHDNATDVVGLLLPQFGLVSGGCKLLEVPVLRSRSFSSRVHESETKICLSSSTANTHEFVVNQS